MHSSLLLTGLILVTISGTIYKTTIVPSRTFCIVRLQSSSQIFTVDIMVSKIAFSINVLWKPEISIMMYIINYFQILILKSDIAVILSFVQVSFGQSEAKVCQLFA
jgi:hypothetical protein